MASSAKIGQTTTLTWNVTTVVELTSIGGVSITMDKVDSTSFGSANYYKEFLPGLIDPGDVGISGFFRPDDTDGQVALLTDMNARTSRAFIIAFPTALSTTTWTGTAYVTNFATGDVTPGELIPFSGMLSIVGKPTLGVTASANISALTYEDSVGAKTSLPAFAAGTYGPYSVTIATASTYIKVTVTQATAATIVATALGVAWNLTSGVQSGQIIVGAAITTTVLTIVVTDTGKSPKTYTIYVVRP